MLSRQAQIQLHARVIWTTPRSISEHKIILSLGELTILMSQIEAVVFLSASKQLQKVATLLANRRV